MQDESEETQRRWPYVKLSPDILEELGIEAQARGLMPRRLKKGQDAIKLGAQALITQLLREAQKKRERKEGKGE